jgi:hypothetical protein
MATEIRSWQIIGNELVRIETTLAQEGKTEVYDLEDWISHTPSMLGSDIVIIGRQLQTQSGPLDLLGVDRTGNTVIVELKRDKLPREALAQAVDYASDVAFWSVDRLGEACVKFCDRSLEEVLSERFSDINLEEIAINAAQRIILAGFSIESSLERMINWLSDSYDMSINAVIFQYAKTSGGDELLIKTSIISEEIEQQNIRKKKSFKIPMSDEPGVYDPEALKKRLLEYFSQKGLWSAMRIRKGIIPVCFEQGVATRDFLKEEFVRRGLAESESRAGYFLALISTQFGYKKNDFLRQVIQYEYPKNEWEKDNYAIREGYEELLREVLDSVQDQA